MALDGQRLDLLTLAQSELEQRLRDEGRGEQVGREADEQRHGETTDRTGAELEQEECADDGGDVRIEQRQEDAAEAGVDRRADGPSRLELLLDALEDEDV